MLGDKSIFLGILIAWQMLVGFEAYGADPAPSKQPATTVKTGKERLSDKASDEQRIDNCKVPRDKRGTTPRPDSCDHRRTGIVLTN